ncbi:hypothetical protein [Paenibacillus sp. P36]|uniref:hypothetical protein n=1 Tax=Paenibacillus sp. P36 TaxID=3342538 RepID=UPI0038B3CE82
MSKRWVRMFTMCFLITILLAGCSSRSRSETIIIPDAEETSQVKEEQGAYDVKTIYRILSKSSELGTPIGWIHSTSLLSLFDENENTVSMERVDAPYEEHLKLFGIGAKLSFMTFSPASQSIAYVKQENGSFGLNIMTLADQKETVIAPIAMEQLRTLRFGWSNNGRYLVYLSNKSKNKGTSINVYDLMDHNLKTYSFGGWDEADIIGSIQLADDAQSVAIVRSRGKQFYVEIGTWNGSEMVRQYEHLAANDSQVEWIHNDQIAFIGQEGTLYAYDRRNAAFSVLVEGVNAFRLSPDRKSIAYAQDKDTVYAASLYGNNVLNKTQLFKGVIPSLMAWSQDNRRLLLCGWKPYEWDKPRAAPAPAPAPESASHSSAAQVVEGASRLNQNLVIEFK